MPCALRTPADVLAAVLACAQAGLDTVPDVVVAGPAGAGGAYSCCPNGTLAVEYETLDPRDGERSTTKGGGPCQDVWTMLVTVKVRRCVEAFEKTAGGATDGSAPSPDVRTDAMLLGVAEGWALLEHLTCCVRTDWAGCGVQLVSQRYVPPTAGCFGHDTIIRFEVRTCCTEGAS